MKNIIKTLLREGLEGIRYDVEHLSSHGGQDNYELGMYVNDEIVGLVEYTLFDGELTVSNIVVRPEFRRKGFGSRMMQYLKTYHKDHKYVPSMKTDLGAKFKHKDIKGDMTSDSFVLFNEEYNDGNW